MRLHHIGILTRDIAASIDLYSNLFGFRLQEEPVVDPKQDCTLCMLSNQAGLNIELIEPFENSPVGRLLEKRGSGPVHLCYETPSFDSDCINLRNSGFIPVGPPVKAVLFENKRVMFFLSPQEELIEIVEG